MRHSLLAAGLCVVIAASAHAGDVRNFEDAALHAVQFVDANEGWAVGDEGVVWHTMDGGGSWERQSTGLRASLRSVHFLNPYTGWIAGREELPHGAGSSGVLLFTKDGGLKWRRVGTNALPGLNKVQFINHDIGFVVGDGSDTFATGVLRTTDAGKSWKPLAGKSWPCWLAADFQDEQNGALAGAWGNLAVLRQNVLVGAEVDALSGRMVQDIRVTGERGVAVGQGGLVLTSRNSRGARWGYADLNLPTEIRACLDFHTVFCLNDHTWVGGRPGSVLLYSPDAGQSWQVRHTGQPLPLNALFFQDENNGWAVGEFGSILRTQDGGKSWRVQHRGGQRAAILFVHGRQASLPVDSVAALGADDGFLCTGVRVFASDPSSAAPTRATDPQRLAAAVRQAGGAASESLWQFPIPQHLARAETRELIQFWNRMHADRASEEIVRQLVLAIRLWRPSVIITDYPDTKASGWFSDGLLAEALQEAFKQTDDPGSFPEQLQQLGLEPWKPVKLYAVWNGQAGSHVALSLTEIKTKLEDSPRDFAAPAANLLTDFPLSLPNTRYYRLLASRIPAAANHKNLMQGVELTPGGIARRTSSLVASLDPETGRALRARRNFQAMAEAPSSPLSDPNKLLAEVGPLLKTLPDGHGASAAFQLANQYVRLGQWSLARELFLLMVDRYPSHPLSAEAYRWLIRHNSSSEIRRRHELGQFYILSQTTIRLAGAVESENAKITPALASEALLVEKAQSQRMALLSQREETRQWYRGCLEIGDRLAAFGPLFGNEPSTQFCIQAARRQLGEFEQAKNWYTEFAATHADGPWRDAAAAELWLTNRTGLPPKPTTYCKYADTRPFLDGDFNDSCWQDVRPIVLRDAGGNTAKEYRTEVRLAYDNEFLYLALTCKHPPDRYVPPVKVRPQDADLRPYDRVSLLLDLDRDYSTYFQLQVDQRGCVSEDCWGDRSWNPRWFVAVKSEKDSWQVEAAIPLTELTGDAVTVGRTWACNVVRTLPGRGVQAWSLPADVQPRPEGMGLLMFLPDPDKKKAAK